MKQPILFGLCMLFLLSFSSAYELEFYHSDHLGSPVVVTTESADIIWSSDYDVFGEAVNEQGDGDLKYNQKEKDDTGLLYYGARYYNADTGRFITADTVKGEMTDSQSQNLYVYVKNNPMKYVDPTGNKFRPKNYDSGLDAVNFMNELSGDDFFFYNEESSLIEMTDLIFSDKFTNKNERVLYDLFKELVETDTNFNYVKETFPYSSHRNGNIRVGLSPGSSELGRFSRKIDFSRASIFVHELSHAYTDLFPNEFDYSTETFAVGMENVARKILGEKKRIYYSILPEIVDKKTTPGVERFFKPETFDRIKNNEYHKAVDHYNKHGGYVIIKIQVLNDPAKTTADLVKRKND